MTYIRATSLGDLLLRSAVKWPDNIALIFPDEKITYSQLYERAFEKARLLQGMGIDIDDHVGIMLPNSPACLEWLFACALSGAVAVMINTRYKSHELEYLVENADLRLLVITSEHKQYTDYVGLLNQIYPELESASGDTELAGAPLLERIIVCGDMPVRVGGKMVSEAALLETGELAKKSSVDRRRASLPLGGYCMMMYTSGTTSHPKGCPLSHEAVTRKAFSIVDRLEFLESDRQWNPLPFFHLASLMPMLATFATGGAYITDSHFDAGSAWRQILGEKVTILYPAFPVVMADLVTHPDFAKLDKWQIRLINNVAPPDQLLKNMKLLPHSLHISAYGLTEGTGLSCYSNPDDDDNTRAHRIGTPLDGTLMKVVDADTGIECGPGEKGEMLIKGYSVFDGYYRAPETTAKAFTEDGWFRTGDICSLDEAGRVAYQGRLKDTLKVGGENVSALEIESCLSTHPAIKFAQVVGVPDPRLQEVVAAFVELNPGAACDQEEIIDFCRQRLASFKIPRHVEFVCHWPMSATKVQKFKLRENLMTKLSIQNNG
jgi:acyl-CoA synthetase (AMP-forming)/AMP-acid ligase II